VWNVQEEIRSQEAERKKKKKKLYIYINKKKIERVDFSEY
jgi:hypothetical protein